MKLHPIRKMQLASLRVWNATSYRTVAQIERGEQQAYARHVKPLLDALEAVCTEVEPEHRYCDEACKVRTGLRLLAAWKEPLSACPPRTRHAASWTASSSRMREYK